MQLTKDDVENWEEYGDWLNLKKFQQVVEFYEKYKGLNGQFDCEKDEHAVYLTWFKKEYLKHPEWDDWLFNYCFVDGLK